MKNTLYSLICAAVVFGSGCGSGGSGDPGDGSGVDGGDPGPDSDVTEACNGCAAGNSCLPGTSDDACGAGGESCQACGDGESCAAGECGEIVENCRPGNCDGCCSGDTCLGGDSSSACGQGGDACTDCGSGFECEAAACSVLENSRWDLTLVWAVVSGVNLDGEPWDSDPIGDDDEPPDVHIDVWVGAGGQERMATSDTVENTTEPSFDETVLSDVPAGLLLDRLEMRAMDVDPLADETIGRCSADVDSRSFSDSELVLECPRDVDQNQGGFSLGYRLTPH